MPLPTDAAYLAGFIDGEGSLGIYSVKDNHNNNRHGNRYYLPRLSVSNTNKEVLEHIQSVWGGAIHSCGIHKGGGFIMGRQTMYRLQWQAQSAIVDVLTNILPYLVLKREQAELLSLWCESRQYRPSHRAGYTEAEIILAQSVNGFNSNKGGISHESVTCAKFNHSK